MAKAGKKTARAVYLTELSAIGEHSAAGGRIYFGHEFCHWRIAGRGQVEEARREARSLGAAFTLVTPALDEEGLPRLEKMLEALRPAEGDEVVVNDAGALEVLKSGKWKGEVIAGRLLSRQRRGAGWTGEAPGKGSVERFLKGSSLDSPGYAGYLREEYGVRRFEIDNLLQGTEVGDLPPGVRLSLYHPFVLLTATRLCPWTFDGKRWRRGEECPACRGEILELSRVGGGRPILMGGGIQFLENDSGELFEHPALDRHVLQPRIPA